MKRRYLLSFVTVFTFSLLFSIVLKSINPPIALAQTNTNILISAAASLTDSLEEIKIEFEKANPLIKITYNFGASGSLQQQIEQGAPVDIFISAAARQMDALVEKGLIDESTLQNLLTNSLVLIIPSNSTLKITDFTSLTNSDVKKISVGEPRSVPVGQYTEEVFTNLGIMAQVKPKLVYANTVRNVLAAVETGNVDAGVVFTTDAQITDKVKVVVTADSNLHSPIVYPMAVLNNSKNPEAAKTFTQYLTSDSAKTIFKKYGFGLSS
jgi:molybdate transport system substrate-binding protein